MAFRSKAFWEYDDDFMELCRDDLTLTPEKLSQKPHYLLEDEGQVAGFYNFLETPKSVYLHNLFVAPENIGKGVGTRLWKHMLGEAERLGYPFILTESDPYAEAFYLAKGIKRIGSVTSTVIAGRTLPLLEFKLSTSETR